eukprot:5691_1
MTGEDFNGCTTADDITQLFDTITKIIGTKVYKCLEKIRNKRRKNNKNNKNNRYNNNNNNTKQHANGIDDKNNYNLLLDKYDKATNTISSLKQNITQKERETNK